MIKKQYIGLILGIMSSAMIEPQQSMQHTAQLRQDIVFAFDIHSVLAKPDIWQMVKIISKALYHEPSLIFKLHPYTFSSGEYAQYPALRHVYNAFVPIEESWEIVRQLDALGYPLYIFSNINTLAFDEMRTKFHKYFDIFDGHLVITHKDMAYHKPNLGAYERFCELVAQQFPHAKIIFIDNKQRNINACKQVGITGIVFKSPEQLAATLSGPPYAIPLKIM